MGLSGIYPPFISVGENGKAQGYEVKVLEMVGEALGYEIKWEFAEFSGIFGMLDAGKIDTVSNLIVMRQKSVVQNMIFNPLCLFRCYSSCT